MKIAVNILGTSKNLNRLRVLMAGAIKSEIHEVTMNFVAQGPRPDFLPSSWNWISADHVEKSDRHVHALREGIANSSYDYNIFCDDDVMIDIDKFCEFANDRNSKPTLWSAFPGMFLHQKQNGKYVTNAKKYFNVPEMDFSNCWIGWSTSVVNKKFMEVCSANPKLFDSLMLLSHDLGAECFQPDNQVPILSHIIGADHIEGRGSGCTVWPAFLDSSVLLGSGKQWHIHHTGENPFFQPQTLIDVLGKSKYSDKENLIDDLFTVLTRGVKAKDVVGNNYDVGWFWCPWTGKANPHNSYGKVMFDLRLEHDRQFSIKKNDYGGPLKSTWEACEAGFELEWGGGIKMVVKWRYKNSLVGYPKGHKNCFGHMIWLIPK